ncbi:hypothetical protein SGLAM104S_10642 [Streptomyces glaucescens]
MSWISRPYVRTSVGRSSYVMTAYTPGVASAWEVSIDTISAWATVERRVWPQSMSSCHMSDANANSPVTLRVPSGRSVDAPMPPRAWEPWVSLVGAPVVGMVGPPLTTGTPPGEPRP